jgi:hypothetical protein
VALLVAGIAAAAISPSYNLNGFGAGSSATEDSFFGSGAGSGGDRLLWRASIEHTPLSTDPAAPAEITGGSLSATSLGRGGGGTIDATFTGGTVTLDPDSSGRGMCGRQVFDVAGDLAYEGGTGSFTVQLTQQRIRFFNRCLTLLSNVSGAPGLTLTPSGPVDEF